jgi:hypothetical protein
MAANGTTIESYWQAELGKVADVGTLLKKDFGFRRVSGG